MPTTQNNPYTKAAYLVVTCPELLYFGVTYSNCHHCTRDVRASGSVWTSCIIQKNSLAYFCHQVPCHLVFAENESTSQKGRNGEKKGHMFVLILGNDHFLSKMSAVIFFLFLKKLMLNNILQSREKIFESEAAEEGRGVYCSQGGLLRRSWIALEKRSLLKLHLKSRIYCGCGWEGQSCDSVTASPGGKEGTWHSASPVSTLGRRLRDTGLSLTCVVSKCLINESFIRKFIKFFFFPQPMTSKVLIVVDQ